jgi:hypothetical protein
MVANVGGKKLRAVSYELRAVKFCSQLNAQGQKKATNLVSRILFLNYHLSGPRITVWILLPTLDLKRAALRRSYTWHYSTQGLPVIAVTSHYCELLPHIFTFSPALLRK